jgi:glycosyltransferase involved in cell wall biosynthesis
MSVLPGIAEYAALHGVPAERVAHIPNGIDPALFGDPVVPPAEGPFVISCFGRFGSANDMDTLVAAAERLHGRHEAADIFIRLVGDGPSKELLRRRAAEAGLTNLEFHELVEKPELVRLSHQSHAFVHTHRRMSVVEKYGMSVNKVFGFMASARPVLFACRSSYDPISEARAGLTVEPEDPAALADAMVRLRRTSPEERHAMGARARWHVLKHHDLSQQARRLEAFLARLIGRAEIRAGRRRAA